ncbi:MAG: hypothetical protein L0J45_00305 [Psychroflexus sp.]|nr:hypothetical protein [Psychroflexus sp.]MDN6309440.1 hypothetical protein [Psychroflexus sp.]
MKDVEKEIRSQMQNREIQPSNHAWFSIVEELDQPAKKSYIKFYFIGGLAAGLVLFFGVYFLYEKQTQGFDFQNKPRFVQREMTVPGKQASVVSIQSNGFTPLIKLKVQQIPTHQFVDRYAFKLSEPGETAGYAQQLLARVEREIQIEESASPLDEVKVLLAEAQSKLSSEEDQEIISQISAQELLADVNTEIEDESFRTKVWDAIKEKFNEAKSALTNL